MKYAPSIAFEEMSGSAKGVTAAKAKGRKYLRNRGYGKKTTTASQSIFKGIFKQLSQSWKNLTTRRLIRGQKICDTPSQSCPSSNKT
jgi:hypothetical protein